MFFVQVFYTIISFTWWIVRTVSLLISITFLLYLMPKQWSCFFRNTFFYIRYSILFCLFPWVDWSLNRIFIMIKLYEVFSILFLRGICCWSSFILDKLYPYLDKTEILELSLQISFSVGFSILLLLFYLLCLLYFLCQSFEQTFIYLMI